MKKYVTLLVLCMFSMLMMAQEHNTVEFNYDDAGNMILRQTIYLQETIIKSGEEVDSIGNDIDQMFPADEIVMNDILVQIYPNPTRGKFKVRLLNLKSTDQVSYAMYALTGQLLFKGQILNTETELDLNTFDNGSYLFKIVVNAQPNTWTIIKR